MSNYIAEVEHRIAGIPCLIGVIEYTHVKGSYVHDADSDWDFYGYTDSTWDVLDRNGRKAAWLAKKLNDREEELVEEAIIEYFQELENSF